MSNKEKRYREDILSVSPESYGELHKEHLLEQYKIYIQSIDYVSELKHKINQYFLGINTVLITTVGVSITKSSFFEAGMWHTIIPIIGILLCLIWWYSNRAYKLTNRVKFKILHKIEKYLPLQLYSYEFAVMKSKMLGISKYPSSTIEPLVPWIFIILYVLIFFFIG